MAGFCHFCMGSVQKPSRFGPFQPHQSFGKIPAVKKAGDAPQFPVLVSVNELFRLLPVHPQQLMGQPGRQPQYRHCLCLDFVVVHFESHSGSAGRKIVVPDVPAAGSG